MGYPIIWSIKIFRIRTITQPHRKKSRSPSLENGPWYFGVFFDDEFESAVRKIRTSPKFRNSGEISSFDSLT